MAHNMIRQLAIALLVCPAWAGVQDVATPPSSGQGLDKALSALIGADEFARSQAWSQLRAAPEEASALALAGFAGAERVARQARARLLEEVAQPSTALEMVSLLKDSLPEVRASLARALARPALGVAALDGRVAALEGLALDDPNSEVRQAARTALGALDGDGAVAALARLVLALPAPERASCAAQIPTSARGADTIARLVRAGFAPLASGERTPPDVIAALLPAHGRLLADRVGGAERAADRAPLILGVRHPDPLVRLAAAEAFDELLARLREHEETGRAMDVLMRLEEEGLDGRMTRYHRARIAFFPGMDALAAREAARGIRVAGGASSAAADDETTSAALWLFRSHYLEAMAELALDQPDAAARSLIEATAVVDGMLGQRLDLRAEALRYGHVEALQLRAMIGVADILVRLSSGTAPDDQELLSAARDAHVVSLEAQGQLAALKGEAIIGWDTLLDADLSPFGLLFNGRPFPDLDAAHQITLVQNLGRALATISPIEMPGFVPFPVQDELLGDPLVDPERIALLQDIAFGRLEGIARELDEVRTRVARGQASPLWVVPEEDILAMETLDLRQRMILSELSRGDLEGWDFLIELRIPGSQALWLARDLRTENRGAESRTVAARYRDDLEGNLSNWWYYLGQERIARADLLIGGSFTDDDMPREAEEALLDAVERIESIEERLEENGVSELALGRYRAIRSTALVSLAVNANVKLGDQEKALAYYERAYELRQDDFMRVLLACYRARMGRADEARALVREVRPGPALYYNLACTHALMGETVKALEWLELELRENHPSAASRKRQQEWARSDPDLKSLRDDPRFEVLVGR